MCLDDDSDDGCLVSTSDSDDGSEEQQRLAQEDLIDFHFNFEIKRVCLFLCSPVTQRSRAQDPGFCFVLPRSGECKVWLHCVQVLLELTRQAQQEKTVLSMSVCQLGAEGQKKSFDLSVTSYLRRVSLDYCDVPGNGKTLLISFCQVV